MRTMVGPDIDGRPNSLSDLETSDSWQAVMSLHGDADVLDDLSDGLGDDAGPLAGPGDDDHIGEDLDTH